MKAPRALENFLNRFSYVAKLLFVMFVGLSAAFLLSYGQYLLQAPLIDQYKLQLTGYSICKELDHLKYQLNVTLPSEGSSEIREKEYIKQFSESTLAVVDQHFGKSSEVYRELENQNQKLARIWAPPFSSYFPWAQRLETINVLQEMLDTIIFNFDLNLGITIPIQQLATTLTYEMPPAIDGLIANTALLNIVNDHELLGSEVSIQIQTNQHMMEQAISKLNTAPQRLAENEELGDQKSLGPFILQLQNFLKILDDRPPSASRLEEINLSTAKTLKSFQVTSSVGYDALHNFLTEQESHMRLILFVALLAVIVTSTTGILVWATRVVRKPLENLQKASDELAKGNLSVRVPITSKDEVANTSKQFNNMAKFFELIMIDARQIADELTKSTSHIFNTAKQLEEGIQKQEYAIHQIATSTKNISLTVKNFANYLQDVHKTAIATSHFAETGRLSLLEMEAIIKQIVGSSNNIVSALSVLKQQGDEINNVINTIVKIADQSNLLSLNTAIRAGKTGLKGIGFAVVADKIRELADQTANATLDIEGVVREIVHVVAESVEEVEDFSGQILHQVGNEKTISNKLKDVIGHTQQQIQIIDEVNLGMQDQAKRAQLIHESLNNLMGGAQTSSQSIRKLYQEIETLYNITANLQTLIGKFSFSKEQ